MILFAALGLACDGLLVVHGGAGAGGDDGGTADADAVDADGAEAREAGW